MQFMNNNSERVLQQDAQSTKNEDIKIFGKLVPASTEGVVASAINIWDDKKVKNQEDINAELYKGESDIRDQYVKKSGDTMTGKLVGTSIIADYISAEDCVSTSKALVGENFIVSDNYFEYKDPTNKTLELDQNGLWYGHDYYKAVFKADNDGVIAKQVTVADNDSNAHAIITPSEIAVSDGNDNQTKINKTSVKTLIIDTARIKNDSGDNVQINKPFVFTTDDSYFSTTINTNGSIYIYNKNNKKNVVSLNTSYGVSLYLSSCSLSGINYLTNAERKVIYNGGNYDIFTASHFKLRDGTESQLLSADGNTATPITDNDINDLFN